jgi:hypothetical protein
MPDEVATYLAEARAGIEQGLDPRTGPNVGLCRAIADGSGRLLAAVEAVWARTGEPGALVSAEGIREAISRELLGEGESRG